MNKLFFTILLLMITGFAFGQKTANLTVNILNTELTNNKLFVGLYDNEASFKQKLSAIDSMIIIPKTEICEVIFKNIPTGNYAVAVFQDMNSNGKIDLGKLKIPTEPVGISNYSARKSKLPPTFKKAQISFLRDTLISITMIKNQVTTNPK